MLAPFSVEVLRELNIPLAQADSLRLPLRFYRDQWVMLDALRAHRTMVLQQLSPAQRLRLEELTLQWRGALDAFLRPGVAAKLGLSAAQTARVEAINALYRDGLGNAAQYAGRFGHTDGRHELHLNQAADTLAESVLSVEQRLRWEEMQGRRLDPEPLHWRRALR